VSARAAAGEAERGRKRSSRLSGWIGRGSSARGGGSTAGEKAGDERDRRVQGCRAVQDGLARSSAHARTRDGFQSLLVDLRRPLTAHFESLALSTGQGMSLGSSHLVAQCPTTPSSSTRGRTGSSRAFRATAARARAGQARDPERRRRRLGGAPRCGRERRASATAGARDGVSEGGPVRSARAREGVRARKRSAPRRGPQGLRERAGGRVALLREGRPARWSARRQRRPLEEARGRGREARDAPSAAT